MSKQSKIENFMFHLVAYDWTGDGFWNRQSPPLNNDTLRVHGTISDDSDDDTIFTLNNDAFEVWIGYPHKWLYHTSRKEFHKMIRWYLWRWAYGEWFGARRWLFYKLLHRRVQSQLNGQKAKHESTQ